MAAEESFDDDLVAEHVLWVDVYLLILHGAEDVNAASASDGYLSFCLRVEVEQILACKFSWLEVKSSDKTCLLVASDEHFEWTMLHGVVLNDGHGSSYAHAVVSSESGVACCHPFSVDVNIEGVCLEVVWAAFCLLWDDVHVGLKHCCLSVFIARCCALAHDDIACFVDVCLCAFALGPVNEVVGNFFGVS